MTLPAGMPQTLRCGRFELQLSRPLVMGIVNTTPDSFSDGGRYLAADAAIRHARRLLDEGADLLDIGGESTRPGSAAVSEAEELGRVLPVLEALRGCGRPLSVDTRHAAVMRGVLSAGADMINDVAGFRAPGALEAVAGGTAGLCVMHMLGEPSTMQQAPVYRDVVAEVAAFLRDRVSALLACGVARERIVLDPGIGFGKNLEHNLSLLRGLSGLAGLGLPLLLGVSRKSMVGQITGRGVGERMAGSVAAALASVHRGAAIVRVHDVAETKDALAVWQAIEG
ncbi:dihydropteroate synthase [Quisquiliibacterium transsilvanicum]|uniref:Dihydropteroate synthase n=2 Tax=Quisquiliibacterium transsilvanicum TaxID=1549638 RepID=A0A7W8HHZ2_9BURK|nr:dihydropteroate synthase [Quisquiliibacterium transsilvanicum]MBB5272386.1 dihydropteroate synthase [Quisquiliibacterium transsilvanicum]